MMQAYVIFNQGVEQYLGRNLRPVANLAEAIMFTNSEKAEKTFQAVVSQNVLDMKHWFIHVVDSSRTHKKLT